MSDSSPNNDLKRKVRGLEERLAEVLNKLNDYESSNSSQIKNLERQIIDIHEKKLSMFWERMNSYIESNNNDREKLWDNTKDLKEMIEVSESKNSTQNKILKIEQEEINRIQEDKGKEMMKYVDKKLEENKLNVDYLISKSINNKVEWNNFVHNAEIHTLDEILELYKTKEIPEESNINYYQLKKRLTNLLDESQKNGEVLNEEGSKKITEYEIQNRIEDLNRAYFRKNKRKSRGGFLSEKAKVLLAKEKELSQIRQSKLPMKNFSIRLNEDYLNRLKLIADKTGNNRNDLIRDAIEKALERWEDLDDEDLKS